MLKGIDPILNADVLYALRAMGHGDDLIIADTNFPSDSVARETVLGEVLRIDRPALPPSPAGWCRVRRPPPSARRHHPQTYQRIN